MQQRRQIPQKWTERWFGCGSAFTCFIHSFAVDWLTHRVLLLIFCFSVRVCTVSHAISSFCVRLGYSPCTRCTCAENRLWLFTTVIRRNSFFVFLFHIPSVERSVFFAAFWICVFFSHLNFFLLFRARNTIPRASLGRCIGRVAWIHWHIFFQFILCVYWCGCGCFCCCWPSECVLCARRLYFLSTTRSIVRCIYL